MFVSFESEFGSYEGQFARLTQDIRDEALIALCESQKWAGELQVEARTENEKNQGVFRKFRKAFDQSSSKSEAERLQTQRWRAETRKAEILAKLSMFDYQTPFRRLRREHVANTCQWIFKSPAFVDWLTGTSRVLWLTGRLGSGKSMISSSIVTHLTNATSPCDIVAYFYVRFDNAESMKAGTVIGSLLKEMTLSRPSQAFESGKGSITDFTSQWTCFQHAQSMLLPESRYFLVIDGMDELPETELRQVYDFMTGLLTRTDLNVKLLMTSRSFSGHSNSSIFPDGLRINLDDGRVRACVSDDIKTYVTTMLESVLSQETDSTMDPAITSRIRDKLEEDANGM